MRCYKMFSYWGNPGCSGLSACGMKDYGNSKQTSIALGWQKVLVAVFSCMMNNIDRGPNLMNPSYSLSNYAHCSYTTRSCFLSFLGLSETLAKGEICMSRINIKNKFWLLHIPEVQGPARMALNPLWKINFDGEICIENKGLVGLQVDAPDGAFWAFSLHAFWPWPHGQADQLTEILPVRMMD